jgi:hypothetical protein
LTSIVQKNVENMGGIVKKILPKLDTKLSGRYSDADYCDHQDCLCGGIVRN